MIGTVQPLDTRIRSAACPDEVTRGQSARVGEAPRTAVETQEGCKCRGMNGEQTNIMHSALLRTGGPVSGVGASRGATSV